jgi:thiamine-phosphate pyrophosphorylase
VTICLVTDRRQLSPNARTARDEVTALAGWLDEAIGSGIDLIQLRETDLPGGLMSDLSRAVVSNAKGSATRVVVNDRADVAMACGCDGVHLRGDGPPVGRVREFLAWPVARPGSHPSRRSGWPELAEGQGRALKIGRSVHSVAEARTHASADYLIFGAVFDSGAKRGLGLDALSEVAAHRPSVIAIGGITVARASKCIAAGASGVAAIRMFLPPDRADGALGISEATRQLRGIDPPTFGVQ